MHRDKVQETFHNSSNIDVTPACAGNLFSVTFLKRRRIAQYVKPVMFYQLTRIGRGVHQTSDLRRGRRRVADSDIANVDVGRCEAG